MRNLIGAYLLNWGSEMRPTDIENPAFGTMWIHAKVRPRWYWWLCMIKSFCWWWRRKLEYGGRIDFATAVEMSRLCDGPSLFLTSRWDQTPEVNDE